MVSHKETSPGAKNFIRNSIVESRGCMTCHAVGGSGGTVGPSLDQVANRRSRQWLRRWLTDPNAIKDGTKMPNFQFSSGELDKLVAGLGELRRELHAAEIMSGPGDAKKKGELLFREYDCSACHRVGDTGRFIGPNLTWIGKRKPERWEDAWLRDPSAMKPRTFMPNFHFPDNQRRVLVAYLHSLSGGRNAEARRWEDNTAFYLDSRPREIGEMVYRRFGCDGCHGQRGEGGYANVNAAPKGRMPIIVAAARKHSRDALKDIILSGRTPARLDPEGPPPLVCPAWAGDMTEVEADYVYDYLLSIAPPKKKFRFKRSGR